MIFSHYVIDYRKNETGFHVFYLRFDNFSPIQTNYEMVPSYKDKFLFECSVLLLHTTTTTGHHLHNRTKRQMGKS